jgi:hypothetical protein
VTEPGGAPYDGIEHRLHVGLRVRDDAQDLARRRLLLQRLGELTGPRLQDFRGGNLLFLRLAKNVLQVRI